MLWKFDGGCVNNLPSMIMAKASPIAVTPSSISTVLSMMGWTGCRVYVSDLVGRILEIGLYFGIKVRKFAYRYFNVC